MGTVYVGEHVEIGKGVAIKILHPAFSNQQDLVERFRREARAASRIGHPQHHRRDRLRHDRGGVRLLRDGAPRRDRSRRHPVARTAARAHPRLPDRDPDLPGARRRARGGRRPPRSQAGERLPGVARRQGGLRQGAGLRHRAQRGPVAPAHEPRDRDGDARVHGARAGLGRRRRPAQRHLFGGRAALRDGHRLAAAVSEQRAGRAPGPAQRAARRDRPDHRARPRARSRSALSDDDPARVRHRQGAVGPGAGGQRAARPAGHAPARGDDPAGDANLGGGARPARRAASRSDPGERPLRAGAGRGARRSGCAGSGGDDAHHPPRRHAR